ncbi:MAG: FHA domain-containing protein [Deltaproteobacteria bacterium]|nr:FHA domain-containing protein [Deltaproteobacteria bacterium]
MRPALVVESDVDGLVRPFRIGAPIFLDQRPEGLTIGRLRGELLIQWHNMQRRMCLVIANDRREVFITQINQRGGVFLNDVELPPAGSHRLAAGDVIGFGSWGAHVPNCPVRMRFDLLEDNEPFARVARIGPWWVLECDDALEPGLRRAFRPGSDGLLYVVSTRTDDDDDDAWTSVAGVRSALPPIVEVWRDRALVHRAFEWNGGARLGTLLELAGPGLLDPAMAARILVDVARAMAAAWDFAHVQLELWDLHVAWTGAVIVLPRQHERRIRDVADGGALAALFHALVPGDGRLAPLAPRTNMEMWSFDDVELAVRAFVAEVGSVADDDALAALARSVCSAEHDADLVLREQVALLDAAGAERLLTR